MTMLPRWTSLSGAILFAMALAACGDESQGPDAAGTPGIDAAVALDGSPRDGAASDGSVADAGSDAAASTVCGTMSCDRATSVCVEHGPVGPGFSHTCEPIPAGCDADRGCGCAGVALCTGAFDTCSESGDNHLLCECPLCQ